MPAVIIQNHIKIVQSQICIESQKFTNRRKERIKATLTIRCVPSSIFEI